MYTLDHEAGHMVVDQFGLPVLAREEDAADNLATLMALSDFAEAEDRVLDAAAYGWALGEAWEAEVEDADLADEHSLDQQRAYAMVCLMVGSDPDAFGGVADEWGLEPDRQESCAFDFQQAEASWDAVMEPHRGASEGAIEVVYDEADDGFEEIADYLQETEILEIAAARVESEFALPAP